VSFNGHLNLHYSWLTSGTFLLLEFCEHFAVFKAYAFGTQILPAFLSFGTTVAPPGF